MKPAPAPYAFTAPRTVLRTVLMKPFALALILVALGGCDAPPAPGGPRYAQAPQGSSTPVLRFAIHPLHNPQKLASAYQPLIDHLNRQLSGVQLELEASRDYAEFERKLRQRGPDFLLPNPWQTLEAGKVGYHVLAMAGEASDFKGLILVRRDSRIGQISDLKGKPISYPSPTALAACILPQWFFRSNGLDVTRDLDNRYVGSQESSILNVYLGQTSAGATWPPPWRAFQKDHPREAAELRVAWETPSLINNSVMARDDVPEAIVATVRRTLLELEGSAAGREILAGMETARFRPAGDKDYEQVRQFIAEFEAKVRKVEDRR